MVAGLITGAKYKVLGIDGNKWLYSAKYYDNKYNVIHSVDELYPAGTDATYSTYDFAGNPTRIKKLQIINYKEEGYDRYYEYDEYGRLAEVKQKILGNINQPVVSIVKYKYNGLSQVIEKTNHNDIDTTIYKYGIDGRLIGEESPLFAYNLYFDKKPDNMTFPFTPRYDGNASMMEWFNGNLRAYRYEYDDLKQFKNSIFMNKSGDTWSSEKRYGEKDVTYDLNGNIKTLKRTGSTTDYIHDIAYTYDGNKLMKTVINGTEYNYAYDGNGNMISDGYKGINIVYNILNLPERIFAGTDEVSYIYNSTGQKLATKAGSSFTYYRGDLVYNDGELDHIIHPEGLARKASGGFVYYYAKKDHIGSTRVLCYHQAGAMRAVQTTDYYPFGLSFFSASTNYNRYLFSGKELQDQNVGGKKLMLYDFGARNYDPTLGRWFNIDPALQFTNPYTYCANNPVMYVDPNGEWTKVYPIYGDNGYKGTEFTLEDGNYTPELSFSVGGSTVTPYLNEYNEIIGYSTYRNGRIEYIMGPNDLDHFSRNVGTYEFVMDLWYMNGEPDWEMIDDIQNMRVGKVLAKQWMGAITNPGYYFFLANAIGGAAMMAGNATTKVYRVYGGKSDPIGTYWTPINPNSVNNYRNTAGLPPENAGRFVIEATTHNSNIRVTPGGAIRIGNNAGGLTEYKLIDPTKITIKRVSGVNPEF